MKSFLEFAHQTVDEKLVPGMTVGIIDQDDTLIDCYGVASYPDEPLDADMVYDIASITKMFTTTRILQLIEDEHLDFDTPVYTVLPNFREHSINIDHLLLHRSGMAPSLSGRYTMTREQMIQSIMNCDDWLHPVDTIMAYSCINYLILGLIIEALDKPLEFSIREHILDPLLMNDTGFNPSNPHRCVPTELTDHRGLIRGQVHDETALGFGGIAGNAGLFSTIDDMLKFANGYLQQTILKPETIAILRTTNIASRSYGWNIHTYDGRDYLFHTGFTGPSILLDFEMHRALIILTNRIHPTRDDTGYIQRRLELFDAFLAK
ncbi:beta-lactamase family protein [Erysipelothrix sp. HDW6C]|uniref:serine hydrolase domain-containing protein n=1 Tax=Erysipelothrix sp. HDW6C TaxID=2714930 RepID=UPI00140DA331|nr:serine hydrolase domain-containing protein [Erysipelothrix sp. HDW6C]QIK69153.1 beta-lactamase family protein [Erysipelothrix sp. HDW6C]